MMSVSRRRPVSRAAGPGSRPAVLFLALLWLACVQTGAATADVRSLVFDSGVTPNRQQADWLKADRTWLKSLPAANAGPGAAFADSLEAGLAVDPQILDRVKRSLDRMAPAGGDTLAGFRPTAALLRDRWFARGFLAASVVAAGDTLTVDPGPVWTVGRFDIGGDDFPGRKHLLATWLPRVGDRFRQIEFVEGIGMVLAGAGEAGYPFARWVTRQVRLESADNTVVIEARLLPGTQAFIGPVTSDLEQGRAARFLARTAGIRAGDRFRNSDLDRAVNRLLSRDLYATVGRPEVYLTSAADTVGIHFPVVPRRKVNRLQVVLGLSRRDDDSGSRLSGEVDLRLPNMAGSGRRLQIGWRDDGNRKSRFGFSYLEPLAFGTPLDMGLALDNEIEQDSYTRFRFDNVWSLPVVALWGLDLGVGWDRSTFPVGALERTSRTRVRGAVQHKRGDRTRSGWEGLFAIENAWRKASQRTADDLGTVSTRQLAEAVTQQIFEVDVAGELWLGNALSFSGRASFRQLTGGDRVAPLSEQFRFGGAATLRGYREDEFNGSRAAWSGVEMRIGRPQGSRLYTFYDLGYFDFWANEPLPDDPDRTVLISGWPRGYGLGILARTPAGDISLAIGFPGTVDFDQAKLHVTLLESF